MLLKKSDKLASDLAGLRDQLATDIAGEVRKSLESAIGKLAEERERLAKVTDLERKIEQLTIAKDRMEENNKRSIRDTEHSTGLLRQKVEADQKNAQAEAKIAAEQARLEVRTENLTADKKRFGDEKEFQREQMQREMDSLREIVKALLDRLPNIEASLSVERSDRPGVPARRSPRRDEE